MRRMIAAEALCAAGASGALYFRTLAPGVGSGDSGELMLAAQSWGVPHPPGYPLWALLARIAAALPAATLAWRVNALSAVLASLAVGLLYAFARRVGAGRFGATVASAFFAASAPLWAAAVEAEVYALAIVAFLGMAHAALSAREARSAGVRADAWFFFVAGLSFLAHQTLAAPAVVLAVWVLAGRGGFTWPRAARAAVFTIAGLSPALLVPFRVAAGASLLWKERAPWVAFGDVFTREAYGAVAQNRWRLDLVVGDLALMARVVASGLGIAAVALVAVALIAGFRRRSPRAMRGLSLVVAHACAAVAVPITLAAVLVFTPDAEHAAQVTPFLLPVVAVGAIAAGWGARWTAHAVRHMRSPFNLRVAAAGAIAGCIVVSTAVEFPSRDRSRFTLPERYGRELLASVPRGATLVVDGDNETFLAGYLQRVEGLRPDITLVHRRGCLFGDANGLAGHPRAEWEARAQAADLARIADPARSIYFVSPPTDLEAAGVRFHVEGLVSRAIAPGAAMPAAWTPPAAWPRVASLVSEDARRYDYVTRKIAISYPDAAARAALQRGDLAGAAAWYQDAAAAGFDMPEAQWNVAVTAAATGNADGALDALLAARSLAPTRSESASRLALFLASAGRYADAARWFERAYRDAPSAALASDAARAWTQAGEAARASAWRGRAAERRVG